MNMRASETFKIIKHYQMRISWTLEKFKAFSWSQLNLPFETHSTVDSYFVQPLALRFT